MSFNWSANSAFNKIKSDVSIGVGIPGIISISKKITDPYDPNKDAYRACSKCGKHINYHINGKCPNK